MAESSARLIRGRILHTRIAAAFLILLLLFQYPLLPSQGVLRGLLETAGYALLIACVLGRVWCSAYIGGRKKRDLVASGPFSIVRNPLYVFSFLGVIGIGLVSGTVTLLVALPALFAVYYRVVVAREEAVLTEKFGEAYRAYCRAVPRWVPNFRLWREAAEPVVEPRFVFNTMRDSVWFFVALPAFQSIEWLHEQGILPTLLRLP